MKYAFMSFSCTDFTLEEMIEAAKRYGYQGLEPRAGSGHRHGIELGISKEQQNEIKRLTEDHGIELCCLAISAKFSDPASFGKFVEETKRYIELAAGINAPLIRVFGGVLPGGVTREQASDQLVQAFGELAPIAQEHGVTLAVETHDHWSDPSYLAAVLEKVNHPAIGINWDVYHPLRRAGLSIDQAFNIVRPWLKHVHFHDGMDTAEKSAYMAMGTGQVDHRRVVELLLSIGYDGYLSGEWIKWEPCDIHLPREIAAMRRYEAQSM